MNKENLAKISAVEFNQIQHLERERFAKINQGILPHPIFKKPVKVKILILVDTGISFNRYYFGLSEVLNTLYNNPEWWVNFDITKAHRFNDPNPPAGGTPAFDLYGPDFTNFRFDQPGFDLDDYDQLWIYGFNNSASFPQALSEDELEIVYRWMNERQGGVLAMGDHADLGASLCSEIPRVRNMRKWRVGVPQNFGPDRHDTLQKGHDDPLTAGVDESDRYSFDDESDDIPMRITPRWYHSHLCNYGFTPKHYIWPYKWRKFPHPVLCGKDGVIKVLPDHPHEGEVVVPSTFTDTLTFNGYSKPEYPIIGSKRVKPEIIAWADVLTDHTNVSDTNKGEANPKRFGAIGAYNGHCAKVGRVIVDSTWHHWFDVNLNGRLIIWTDTPGFNTYDDSNDPRKLNGFNDTAQGRKAYEKIKNYFRNVAIWLSPPKKIKAMACVAMWNSIFRYPLYADFNSKIPIWQLGHHAIDVLGKYAGQCQVRSWWPIFMPEYPFDKLFNAQRVKFPNFQLENIDEFMLGGIFKSMLIYREKNMVDKDEAVDDKILGQIVTEGLRMGVEELQLVIRQKETAERNVKSSIKEMMEYIK